MPAQVLLNDLMHDGSRNFVLLPQTHAPLRVLLHVFMLLGAYPTAYLPSMIGSWIDFRYRGYKFSINNQYGDFWFFVRDPACPDELLASVSRHFEKLLVSKDGA